jgi:hypothetical protein
VRQPEQIHLGVRRTSNIEPEPPCSLETAEDILSSVERVRRPAPPACLSPMRHVQICEAGADRQRRATSIGIPHRFPVRRVTEFHRGGLTASAPYEIQLIDLFDQMSCEPLHGRRRRVAQIGKRQER